MVEGGKINMDYKILEQNNPNNEEYFLTILLRNLKELDYSLTRYLVEDFYREEEITRTNVMSDIAKILGQRIRRYRTAKGLSQEKLAEFSGCHPTYIGQIERGEKNATIESIEKISAALNVSLSTLLADSDLL